MLVAIRRATFFVTTYACRGPASSSWSSGCRTKAKEEMTMTRSRAWTKSHQTRSGTFKIEHRVLEGSDRYILWFDDKELGAYGFAPAAAASISEGKHDQILGLEASRLGVPLSLALWNGGR
jgi:hypothetical protein